MYVDIESIKDAYHRNGVSGEGFRVLTFDKVEGERKEKMLAVTFCTPNGDNRGYTAILSLNDLALLFLNGDHPKNLSCWRGDVFEEELQPELKRLDYERMAQILSGRY